MFEMRRAGGADQHSIELKDFFSGCSAIWIPLIGWTTILKLSLIGGGGETRDSRNWDPERIQRGHSARAAGLFDMRRAEGAEWREPWANAGIDQHAPVRSRYRC